MKKIIYIFLITALIVFSKTNATAQCNSTLVTVCSAEIGDGATYLKELRAKLQAHKNGQQKPVARYSLLLNKGNHYRFNVCGAQEFDSEPILQLYDKSKLLGSTYFAKNDKHYPAFDFVCSKTGVYKVLVSFTEGDEGCAVGILSLIKN